MNLVLLCISVDITELALWLPINTGGHRSQSSSIKHGPSLEEQKLCGLLTFSSFTVLQVDKSRLNAFLFGYVNIALGSCAQGECTVLLGVRGIWGQMLKWPIQIHW